MEAQLPLLQTDQGTYAARSQNLLQAILKDHFLRFADSYDQHYAARYGHQRLNRISSVVQRFGVCGDYTQGVARIRCTNSHCGHDYFRPFSCKAFHLCPSCSQKRTLLLGEYLSQRLLLQLPHRQFVFSLPKALCVFFRYHPELFGEVARLLFTIINHFYHRAAGVKLITAAVIAYQSFGDLLRWNPHFHALVLEGGFDPQGRFSFVPLGDLARMT